MEKNNFCRNISWLLTVTFLVLGIYDLASKSDKEEKYQSTVDSLNGKYDNIQNEFNRLKATNDAYYSLLQVLGYKIDTTKAEGKKNADNLIDIIKSIPAAQNEKEMTEIADASIEFRELIDKISQFDRNALDEVLRIKNSNPNSQRGKYAARIIHFMLWKLKGT